MHRFYERDDGKQVNIFYCDAPFCEHRKIVVYDPEKVNGLLSIEGWGVVGKRNLDGSIEPEKVYCPFHFKKHA